MARWTASAKWAAGPALDGQRDMPLGLSLSEGLGRILDVDGEPIDQARELRRKILHHGFTVGSPERDP